MNDPDNSVQARHRRCRIAYGITPYALELIVAVMAHERTFKRGLTRKRAAELLNVTDVNAGPLIRLGWMVGDATPAPNQVLTVTPQGWKKVWPWQHGWPVIPARQLRQLIATQLVAVGR